MMFYKNTYIKFYIRIYEKFANAKEYNNGGIVCVDTCAGI